MERARRYCSTPTCGAIVTKPGRCARCRQQADQRRGSASARGYDAEWAAYSRAWLERHRWCGERADGQIFSDDSRCAREGRRVRATVTDHLQALRAGGARLDPANHQSLCADCNRRKAIAHEGALSRV